MRPFDLTAPTTVEAALASPGTFLAGGTTLVDLMKLNVLTPGHVTDINALPLRGIDTSATHFGLRDLRERVRRLGGTFSIRPGDDSGVVLRARLPLGK